jgi:hypothetical protein
VTRGRGRYWRGFKVEQLARELNEAMKYAHGEGKIKMTSFLGRSTGTLR